MKYCSKCGAELHDDAVICPKCGCAVEGQGVLLGKSEKKWITTFLLSFFLGAIGAHRFYVGRTGSGIAMLLTFGGLGIWTLIDLIVILCGSFKDSKGNKIKNS